MSTSINYGGTIQILSKTKYEDILTPQALAFLGMLHEKFSFQIEKLLIERKIKQQLYQQGIAPLFLEKTKEVRTSLWKVAELPQDLLDRRVEITGPVDRKMIINALNSGANMFMADFEDATAPTWKNVVEGQINLRDAIRGTITFEDKGKKYTLQENTATLLVRPRGWHLPEKHLKFNHRYAVGALVDFGLYFFHNAQQLLKNGSGPYFYLPKLEGHLEARLWNDVFSFAQKLLDIPLGTIKATVLIETLPAAFEMDEILFELRDHSAGLNCGRWDYIFSYIKTFREQKEFVLPDRSLVTMQQPFMRAYTQLLVKTCHNRDVHAMGGMAAQIPVKEDQGKNEHALLRVQEDKLREVTDGHDGTWVAHPALVQVAKKVFDEHMPNKNQIDNKREDVQTKEEDLIAVAHGPISMEGIKNNIIVAIQYMASWLNGRGAVPLYHLMEDAATAEICRTQIWQWLRHAAQTEDGTMITKNVIDKAIQQQMDRIKDEVGEDNFKNDYYQQAKQLFTELIYAEEFIEFLTLPAYEMLLEIE